jgi:hypothetical protein
MAVSIEDVDRVLAQLRRPDKDARARAMKEIGVWGAGPLTPAVGERLLRGAAEAYPPVDDDPATPNADMVRALWNGTQVDPTVVLEVYPRVGGECRESVLRLLAGLSSMPSSVALVRLLDGAREGAGASDDPWPALLPLEHAPRHPELLVDPLVHCLQANIWPTTAASALRAYTQVGLLDARHRPAIAAALVPRLTDLLSRLGVLFYHDRWEDEYRAMAARAELMLDLLGTADVEQGRAVLTTATSHADPSMALWGAVGLIRCGSPVPERVLERVAADPETRLPLLENLDALGQPERFPAGYRNQPALAAAAMVQWLIYPTELGRTPDDLEQVAVVPLEHGEDFADVYVFRFRTSEPHWAAEDGWMVGVAGPYLRSEQPTARDLGATFSRFEPFDPDTLDERVDAILETMAAWWKQRGASVR